MNSRCIFCNRPLDASDEHIIPQSLNGTLHSKNIICGVCNSKTFGQTIDVALANLFKPLVHILNLKNARAVVAEDPNGRKYLKKPNKGGLAPMAPEETIIKHKGVTHVNLSGDPKTVANMFRKRAKKYLKHGISVKYQVYKDHSGALPLSMDFDLPVNNDINLSLNKIVLEFMAFNDLPLDPVKKMLTKTSQLAIMTNVTYCNVTNDVRTFEEKEISHVIAIRVDKSRGLLYGYVELFNLLCAVVVLNDNYEGPTYDSTYVQDAITAERFDRGITINIDGLSLIDNSTQVDNDKLGPLIDSLFERLQGRQIQKALKVGVDRIREAMSKQFPDHDFDKETYRLKLQEHIGRFIAELTIYHFPYSVSDVSDEQRHQINYIHSSINEELYPAFCEANKHIIGAKFVLADKILSRYYMLDSFMTVPVAKWNGKKIVKIYCVLKEEIIGDKKYYPFKVIFDALSDYDKSRKSNGL